MPDVSTQLLIGFLIVIVLAIALLGRDRSKRVYKRGASEMSAVFVVVASLFSSNVVDPRKRDEAMEMEKLSDDDDSDDRDKPNPS